MAYGDGNTTLANFDELIPSTVLKDVAGIMPEEFRSCAEAATIRTARPTKTSVLKGRLFNETVFSNSARMFLDLREKLANRFDEDQTGIFLAIFRCRRQIRCSLLGRRSGVWSTCSKEVVQAVPVTRITRSPTCAWNRGCSSPQIVKRLCNSAAMRRLFPDDRQRLRHIFEKQMFGAVSTEIILRIAKHYTLGFLEDADTGWNTHFVLGDTEKRAEERSLDGPFGPDR